MRHMLDGVWMRLFEINEDACIEARRQLGGDDAAGAKAAVDYLASIDDVAKLRDAQLLVKELSAGQTKSSHLSDHVAYANFEVAVANAIPGQHSPEWLRGFRFELADQVHYGAWIAKGLGKPAIFAEMQSMVRRPIIGSERRNRAQQAVDDNRDG